VRHSRTAAGDREAAMAEHVFKVIELVGTSKESVSDAIDVAVRRAAETIRNLRWFEVVSTRGDIADGKVLHYQVTLKVGFTLEAS
jgi:flavin-binding protein dodecin